MLSSAVFIIKFYLVTFSATNESRIKVLPIFKHADYKNSYAKIFHKHLGAVKIEGNISLIFLKSNTTLFFWALSSIGGDKPFLGIPAKRQHPERAGPSQKGWLLPSKTSMKMLTFLFKPPHGLLNILAQKLSRN